MIFGAHYIPFYLVGASETDVPPETSAGPRRTASFSGDTQTGESASQTEDSARWRDDTDLLTALLEHVLLLLCHHPPLFAAEHHALRAGDVLHVHHQLGTVQRVAVPSTRYTKVSPVLVRVTLGMTY